jgi:hypothetical protein
MPMPQTSWEQKQTSHAQLHIASFFLQPQHRPVLRFACLFEFTISKASVVADCMMACEPDAVLKCGIGLKSSKSGGENCKWKRRWFVLRQGSLSYFKSNRHDKPRCVIPMRALNACVTAGNSSLIYRVGSRELRVNMADISDACEWAHAVRDCQKLECARLQQQSCAEARFAYVFFN